ncbi:MAG: hypothetical protein HFI34_05610 [Lachnospiraceae bacterium]|nr:hypothetical protein [Lachnospiraceae bacterium]
MKTKLFAVLLAFSLLLCGCSGKASELAEINATAKETKNIFAMNTYITLTAYGETAKTALDESENRIQEIESILSVTDESSELYVINHSEGTAVTSGCAAGAFTGGCAQLVVKRSKNVRLNAKTRRTP